MEQQLPRPTALADLADGLDSSTLELLQRLARVAEFREDPLGRHPRRVGRLAARLAEALALPPHEAALLGAAAMLHDVGKVAIPDSILLKPAKLTPEEFDVLKTHAAVGAEILAGSSVEVLDLAAEVALSHHENWDGSGYPRSLRGAEIPVCARIVTVADVFDALTHHRPYRRAHAVGMTLEWLRAESGRQFAPEVVEAFLALAEEEVFLADLEGEGKP